MKCWIVVLAAVIFISCATSNRINRISLGITKQQVVEAMGEPSSTRATQGTEYLIYHLSEASVGRQLFMTYFRITGEVANDYYVRLFNGRVDAYGKVGDFDSTHVPEQKYDVDVAFHQAFPNEPNTTANSSSAPSQTSPFVQAYQAGVKAMADKDFKTAIESFNKAVMFGTSSAPAWTGLGFAYGYSHQFPDAMYCLQHALSLDSTQLVALAGLAGVYGQIGETNKYAKTLEKVRQKDPALADTVAEFVKEENAKADDAARGTGTTSASPLTNPAAPNDPIAAYSQAVKLKPDNEEAWVALGWADDKAGRTDDAIAAYRQAIQLSSFYSGAWNGLGVCYGKAGRTNEAVDALRQAIKLRPDYAEAWYNLGATYGRAGLTNEANDAFQHAKKLNPGLFK